MKSASVKAKAKTTTPSAARLEKTHAARNTAKNPAATPAGPRRASVELPFYRRSDWLAGGLAALLVFIGYWLTLAPDLTLEDSGEMAVAAHYAGVPHPPGYPVWTLYAWAFTKLLPFSNIAWRVAMSSAVAGALACGLIALMVSRGSRLLLASPGWFEALPGRWKTGLAVASGATAGALFGFSGFVWSQAVIVEVYTLSVLSLTAVMACVFRWMHAPQQRRYLYLAWFLFGVCLNNHQSLMVAVLAIEVCVAFADARLGRDLLLGNVVCYVLGLFALGHGWIGMLEHNAPLRGCYHAIGLGSIAAMVWLTIRTGGLGRQFPQALQCAGAFFAGAALYFLLPVLSMSNPPMNWAYARTVPGFFHALSRGQYEPVHPSTSLGTYLQQLGQLAEGAMDEFNPVWLALGLVPLLVLRRLGRAERAWVWGGLAFYLTLGPGLLLLLNPGVDRASQALVRVFFGASQVLVAMAIGLGMALTAGWLLTSTSAAPALALSRATARRWLLIATGLAASWGIGHVLWTAHATDLVLSQVAAWLSLALIAAIGCLGTWTRFHPARVALLAAFCLMPAHSILSHWWDNEQRGHLFGFWFGHDMFSPPVRDEQGALSYTRETRARALQGPDRALVYPEMPRHAVLFGGTDPGRFCPTYMIFSESFLKPEQRLDPEFDRRDVYIITQNALADGHYLEYIRAHYQRSAQIDPFFFSEFLRSKGEREEGLYTNYLAQAALPLDRTLTCLGRAVEQRRRAAGLYPAAELRLPANADLDRSYSEYLSDWQARAQRGQLNPGEVVQVNGRQAQISGAAAVMGINALLTRQIFEQNPEHEFFVEESFPIEWMYPHLTPFGTILKLERQPVPDLGPAVVERDRHFWRAYMNRLIGDWVKPETNIAEICTFAQKVHLRRDLSAYQGDRKFLRDEQAQKAFSKLRSSIAGVYDWRFRQATGQLHQITQQLAQPALPAPDAQHLRAQQQRLAIVQERMFREAEFASKQAYALCPFAPEAFQRLVNLLVSAGRVSEALAIAETSQRLDPGNAYYTNIAEQLRHLTLRPSQGS